MKALRCGRLALALVLVLLGGGLLGKELWMAAKARLAEQLIERAFAAYQQDGRPRRPWSWADNHPIGRVRVLGEGMQRAVLTGATGSSLAFGLGHVDGTAPPNAPGNCVVAGHRDSWAEFLEELSPGDELGLDSRGGACTYRVTGAKVVSQRDGSVLRSTSSPRLTLVTCYPFGGLLQTPWRYVVTAEPVGGAACPPSLRG